MRVPVVIALLSAACASQSATIPAATTETQAVVINKGTGAVSTIGLTKNETAYTGQFTAAPQALWPALQRVFNTLQLPISSIDSAAHLIVSTPTERIRRIENKPTSFYVECPGTAYGNAASAGLVYINVQAQLLPVATGSELRMGVQAHSVSETGMNRGECRSTGKLEARITEALTH